MLLTPGSERVKILKQIIATLESLTKKTRLKNIVRYFQCKSLDFQVQ